jgi:hypothetical protein
MQGSYRIRRALCYSCVVTPSTSSPSRRGILRALGLAMFAAPLMRLGQWVVRERRMHPHDLPPVPWIGHC